MAKSGTSIQKREKEKARTQNRLDKDARKLDAKERRAKGRDVVDGVDPDIAGIVPGPRLMKNRRGEMDSRNERSERRGILKYFAGASE